VGAQTTFVISRIVISRFYCTSIRLPKLRFFFKSTRNLLKTSRNSYTKVGNYNYSKFWFYTVFIEIEPAVS
jgi:hypothetical protein